MSPGRGPDGGHQSPMVGIFAPPHNLRFQLAIALEETERTQHAVAASRREDNRPEHAVAPHPVERLAHLVFEGVHHARPVHNHLVDLYAPGRRQSAIHQHLGDNVSPDLACEE